MSPAPFYGMSQVEMTLTGLNRELKRPLTGSTAGVRSRSNPRVVYVSEVEDSTRPFSVAPAKKDLPRRPGAGFSAPSMWTMPSHSATRIPEPSALRENEQIVALPKQGKEDARYRHLS